MVCQGKQGQTAPGRGGLEEEQTRRLCIPKSQPRPGAGPRTMVTAQMRANEESWSLEEGDRGEVGDIGVSPRWCFLEHRKEPFKGRILSLHLPGCALSLLFRPQPIISGAGALFPASSPQIKDPLNSGF